MANQPKLIAGFPGTGVTTAVSILSKRFNVTELDIGLFPYHLDVYEILVSKIKANLDKDYVFIPFDITLIKLLMDQGHSVNLIYPVEDFIQDYLDRLHEHVDDPDRIAYTTEILRRTLKRLHELIHPLPVIKKFELIEGQSLDSVIEDVLPLLI